MMKKLLALLVCGSLFVFVLVACGTGAPSAGTEVHMNSTQFVQGEITIQKGQSITLINDDLFTPHIIANGIWENSTAKTESEPNAPIVNNVQINANAQTTIGPFSIAGTFKFYCPIHSGMNLIVKVV